MPVTTTVSLLDPAVQRVIMVFMAVVRMSDSEVARDLHAALGKVQEGVEIIIEQDDRPVAVLKPAPPGGPGRTLSECIALARAYEKRLGEAPLPDSDFAEDVKAGIDSHREPVVPPVWA